MQTPYTYLIGWTKHDKFYYGSKYARDADPKNLWIDYFTSSKYVEEFRKEHGEPDIIEVRKVFCCPHDAQKWETNVLKRMKVLQDDRWLNKNVGGRIYVSKQNDDWIEKRTKNKNHHPNQKQFALNASKIAAEKRRGQKDSEETKQKRVSSWKKTFLKNKNLNNGKVSYKKTAIYEIDGLILEGNEAVMERYGISYTTIYNRVKSEKFPTWKRIR